jgi:hypothetical protein
MGKTHTYNKETIEPKSIKVFKKEIKEPIKETVFSKIIKFFK